MGQPSKQLFFLVVCVLVAAATSVVWLFALKERPQADSVTIDASVIMPNDKSDEADVPQVVAAEDSTDILLAPVPVEPRQPAAVSEKAPPSVKPGPFILFYGDGCPHCVKVEWYLDQNGVRDRVDLTLKEVYHDRDNADELAAKAKTCGIPLSQLGVPLLWTGRECLVGEPPIVDFFESLAGR